MIFELAAVQEPESRMRALRRRALRDLEREALVQLADQAPLLLDAVGCQPVRDREAPGMVGQDEPLLAHRPRAPDHALERGAPVRPVRVAVAVADEVAPGHEPRQPAIRGGLDLAPVLAQLGLDRLRSSQR